MRNEYSRSRKLAVWGSALLALLLLLAGAPSPAAAQGCGCQETGEYEAPRTKAPARQELSPGGGVYRLLTSQTATEVQLRVERADNAQLVQAFFLPIARVDWGFSPDGSRFMTRFGRTDAQIDEISLYDLDADRTVYTTSATAGAAVAFSPNGRWFLQNVLLGPGSAETTIKDAVTGETALYAPMAFEAPPGSPGDKFGVIGGGFSPDAEDTAYVWAYRQIGGNIQLSVRNLAKRTTVVSRPVGGSSWWRFSPCGDALGLVDQTSGAYVTVSIYKTSAANQSVGAPKTFSPIPHDIQLESTLESHQVVTWNNSGATTTVIGPNTADTTCPPALGLDAVTVEPTTVDGGDRNATGTVKLTAPATSSLLVNLSSSDTGAASVPSSVTLLSGATSKTFTITSKPVTAAKTVTITAKAGSVTKTATLTVNPVAAAGPAVSAVTVDPARVAGGAPTTGTVTLNAPAGARGAVVALQASAPAAATVPATVSVAANQTTATFPVTTSSVSGDTPVVITASSANTSATARLMVLTTDRECSRGQEDAANETLKARSFGAYDDNGTNVDCGTVVDFENGITVGPGSTGLAPGTPVQLSVTVRLDGSLHTSPPVFSGGATAEGTTQYSIHDDDAPQGEDGLGPIVRFEADFNLQQYVAFPDSENVTWQSDWDLSTNASEPQSNQDYSGSHSPDAVAGYKDTGNITATYNTTVGAHLTIKGRVTTIASAYGTGASAVADFSNTFAAKTVPAPGYEGLDLVYDVTNEPVNKPPVCTGGALSTVENTPVNGSLSCADPEGKALAYTVVNGPANGTLSAIGTGGTFTYTPSTGYSGADSFTFKANDGKLDSAVATFALTVTSVNEAPVCTNTVGTTDEGKPVNGAVSCTDPDGDQLTWQVTQGPANGTVSAVDANGAFTYTPNAGFTGTDTVTVAASDGKGGQAAGTYTVTVKRVLVGPPTNKDECKDGGWQKFNNPTFSNQGQCVSYVETRK